MLCFFMLFLLFHVVLWLGAAAAAVVVAAQRGRGTAHKYDMENKIITRFKNI